MEVSRVDELKAETREEEQKEGVYSESKSVSDYSTYSFDPLDLEEYNPCRVRQSDIEFSIQKNMGKLHFGNVRNL